VCIVSQLSRFFIEHRKLRFRLSMVSNVAWLLGAAVIYLLIFDVHYALWMAALAAASLPIIALNVLAFNRELLKRIATSFQTVVVCGHAAIMIGSLAALFRLQPYKLVASLFLPSLVCAAFMDAYPEEGRHARTSALSFTRARTRARGTHTGFTHARTHARTHTDIRL
jgi:hypothetical protein